MSRLDSRSTVFETSGSIFLAGPRFCRKITRMSCTPTPVVRTAEVRQQRLGKPPARGRTLAHQSRNGTRILPKSNCLESSQWSIPTLLNLNRLFPSGNPMARGGGALAGAQAPNTAQSCSTAGSQARSSHTVVLSMGAPPEIPPDCMSFIMNLVNSTCPKSFFRSVIFLASHW